MKKLLAGAAIAPGPAALPAFAEYPGKEIRGIIQWGAGGSTDTVSGAITPQAEAVLGGSVAMRNVAGGVGAIALNQAASGDADGYTQRFGAENPLLCPVPGLGDKDCAAEPVSAWRARPEGTDGCAPPCLPRDGGLHQPEHQGGQVRLGRAGGPALGRHRDDQRQGAARGDLRAP